MPERTADATWRGSLQEGDGTMRMGSGAYEGRYSFQSRFEEGDETNPEELIAAAHAGCYSMALSGDLGRAGYEPESVDTTATVTIERSGNGFAITRILLETRARVAGVEEEEEEEEFQRIAAATKDGCPVSVALAAVEAIEVDARLVS
jgi:osmotically inducible protein OsmC